MAGTHSKIAVRLTKVSVSAATSSWRGILLAIGLSNTPVVVQKIRNQIGRASGSLVEAGEVNQKVDGIQVGLTD
jgi:hypothetical protein